VPKEPDSEAILLSILEVKEEGVDERLSQKAGLPRGDSRLLARDCISDIGFFRVRRPACHLGRERVLRGWQGDLPRMARSFGATPKFQGVMRLSEGLPMVPL
jgi:hypothetical protein